MSCRPTSSYLTVNCSVHLMASHNSTSLPITKIAQNALTIGQALAPRTEISPRMFQLVFKGSESNADSILAFL
jgi:hypothetical protein